MTIAVSPYVTVLMPVYNGERYLRQAIESILSQTLDAYELLIIDDGSEDRSVEIVDSYPKQNIRILMNERNFGLIYTLNRGIDEAKGKYIARFDCDDVSMRNRLEQQAQFLEEHSDIGILGSACTVIDEEGRETGIVRMPLNDMEIRWSLLLENPFAHPTVMMRRDILVANNLRYDPSQLLVEDYEFWTRVLRVTKGANLAEPLVKYRVHARSQGSLRKSVQTANHNSVSVRNVNALPTRNPLGYDEVKALREWLALDEKCRDLSGRELTRIVCDYLDLFGSFLAVHAGRRIIERMRRAIAIRVLTATLKVRRGVASWGILFKVLRFCPQVLIEVLIRYLNRQSSKRRKRFPERDAC